MRKFSPFIILAIFLCFCANVSARTAPVVTLLRVPDGGIQPQAVVDAGGVVHLLYFKGDPAHGDLYYVSRAPGEESKFSAAIKVNSVAGSAIAKGSIRGGQIVLGKDKQVLVVWNASDGHAVLFSRLNAAKDGFEPQQDLLQDAGVVDGGGTIAADSKGNIFVFLHAVKKGQDEATGRVYMTMSRDNGKTFSASRAIDKPGLGTCPCCSMRASADDKGQIFVLYRTADHDIKRDTTLLASNDGGKTFSSKSMQGWEINACTMSMFALTNTPKVTYAGWETKGKVYFGPASPGTPALSFGNASKYPVMATNQNGDFLYSWTEGAGWEKGGEACWQVCDKAGKALEKPGAQAGVKRWSFTTAVSQPNGNFLLIY